MAVRTRVLAALAFVAVVTAACGGGGSGADDEASDEFSTEAAEEASEDDAAEDEEGAGETGSDDGLDASEESDVAAESGPAFDAPPFAIVDLGGSYEGDTFVWTVQFAQPFLIDPNVYSAGLNFRFDIDDTTSLLGGPQYNEGNYTSGITCLPDPCTFTEAPTTVSDDGLTATVRVVPPPEIEVIDPAAVMMSGSTWLQETADGEQLFQMFPEQGTLPFLSE